MRVYQFVMHVTH